LGVSLFVFSLKPNKPQFRLQRKRQKQYFSILSLSFEEDWSVFGEKINFFTKQIFLRDLRG
jgi:hypothetical protein